MKFADGFVEVKKFQRRIFEKRSADFISEIPSVGECARTKNLLREEQCRYHSEERAWKKFRFIERIDSYTLGAYPTIELIETAPHLVRQALNRSITRNPALHERCQARDSLRGKTRHASDRSQGK